jgi:uncharacterized membrane protein
MESRAKLLGHPVHQMLVVFPLGLLVGAVVFDLLSRVIKNDTLARVGYWNIVGGLIGGAAAAPFGWWDWMAIPGDTRAKRIGGLHGVGNAIVLGLFASVWFMRRQDPETVPTGTLVLEVAAVGLSGVTAWMGGELVDRLGVGVDRNAHLNAPSSLTSESSTLPGSHHS